tara:strand:- start:1689 stop:1877 length:189 start_codon:yes stop_codon:yes gene_type:complete
MNVTKKTLKIYNMVKYKLDADVEDLVCSIRYVLLSYKDKRMKTSELVNNITDIIDKKIDETY